MAIDYTSRDFATIKAALQAHLQAKFATTWRDFYESSMGIAWMELLAWCIDGLSFQLDYQANETYLSTARDRYNVINLCKLIGYQLRPPTSASVVVHATIDAPQAQDVIIRAGTQYTTSRGVVFTTLEDQRIPSGATEADITMVQGDTQNDTFAGTGAQFQKYKLTVPAVTSGSIIVLVDGAEWAQEDSLIFGSADSQIYTIEYDDEDYGYIQFGDGTTGEIPAVASSIEVSYRTGGGVQGNIAVAEIDGLVTGYLFGVVPDVEVSTHLLNEERGSGGEPRETVDHAKLWAPQWVKTNGRAVTEADFDVLATTFVDPVHGSFAFAKAMLHQNIPEYNLVDIYTWARDMGGVITEPSLALKTALQNYFLNNGTGAVRIICTDVQVLDGEQVYVDVAVSIKVESDYSSVAVSSAVSTAISELFSSAENRPGVPFRISKVYKAVQSVEGVDYVLISAVTASKKETEIVGTGTGLVLTFAGTLIVEPGMELVPRTVYFQYGSPATEVLQDDGEGIVRNNAGVAVGTIDYATGVYSATFAAAPALGTQVTAQYREILDYSRGDLEATADGTTGRFKGKIGYPPIVPFTSYMKGVAFTDGVQVVIDDGDGNITGDVDPAGANFVDYGTGGYDFTFAVAPAAGASIRSTYMQALETASEDIPIAANQLAVEGLTTVAIL